MNPLLRSLQVKLGPVDLLMLSRWLTTPSDALLAFKQPIRALQAAVELRRVDLVEALFRTKAWSEQASEKRPAVFSGDLCTVLKPLFQGPALADPEQVAVRQAVCNGVVAMGHPHVMDLLLLHAVDRVGPALVQAMLDAGADFNYLDTRTTQFWGGGECLRVAMDITMDRQDRRCEDLLWPVTNLDQFVTLMNNRLDLLARGTALDVAHYARRLDHFGVRVMAEFRTAHIPAVKALYDRLGAAQLPRLHQVLLTQPRQTELEQARAASSTQRRVRA